MSRFNCCVCGHFVGYEKGKVEVREVASSDYWNGPEEVVTSYCEKHLPTPKIKAK